MMGPKPFKFHPLTLTLSACSDTREGVLEGISRIMTDQDSAEAADLRSLVDEWRKRPGLPCCWIVFAALNIAMMVIGIERLDECPIEPMIPIYLIGEEVDLYR